MTVYTDYVEQRRLDDLFFSLVYQCTLGFEFITWYDQCRSAGR